MKFKRTKKTNFSAVVKMSIAQGKTGVHEKVGTLGFSATGILQIKLIEITDGRARIVIDLVNQLDQDKILIQVNPVVLNPGDTLSVDGIDCRMTVDSMLV